MKTLLLIMVLPALMLIGCGEMQSTQTTAGEYTQALLDQDAISENEANSIDEDLLNEPLEVTEMDASNRVMMKLGGAELLIDFIEEISGQDPQETAMVINGVEVPLAVAADKDSFQGLIASLVANQLEGKEVLGMPASELVQLGLGLINGDTRKETFSNLFGTLIKGAFNMFLSKTPLGGILSPIVEGITGGDQAGNNSGQNNNQNNGNQNNNNNQNNNSGDGLLGSVVNTIGGALTGGNPVVGGILSLILNLFK